MVREREIAKRCGLPLSETVALLQRVHRLQVLDYRPATDEPQLTFLEDRPDSKDLLIDREHLAMRKERYVARAHAMLRYAEDRSHCRSMFLLSYFGESALTRCGCCDTCLERNKADMNDLEFAHAEELVFRMLAEKKCSLEEVLVGLQPLDREHAIRVVEWLIDQGRIRYKGESLLERNGA
jgi:ATP-dependent DNA helicase RecQ